MTTTAATRAVEYTAPAPGLHLAFELGQTHWKLGFTTGLGQRPRERTIAARDVGAVELEIGRAKQRFELPADARVVSCYEAGRDGFWLHRYLVAQGIASHVVDSASIEVNRRRRRAKSDRLDVGKLLFQLVRYRAGERKGWSVVHVPTVAEEDRRQTHRELLTLKRDRARVTNRIKGLLANQGVVVEVAGVSQPAGGGGAGGAGADAGSEGRAEPGARDREGRQPLHPGHGDRDRLGLAAVSAGEPVEPMV